MAKLYWRIKKKGKWTWEPVHWLASHYGVDDDGSRLIRVYDWKSDREES